MGPHCVQLRSGRKARRSLERGRGARGRRRDWCCNSSGRLLEPMVFLHNHRQWMENYRNSLRFAILGTSQDPLKPDKFNYKVTFRVSPKATLKVTPQAHKATFESLWVKPGKSLLSHLLSHFLFSGGSKGFMELQLFSKQGSTPTPWARGLRDQIQKWALQTRKTLYF